MASVTLSSAIRDNLLALQNTSDLIKQTQGRLSTNLKVGSAIDDPVAFFQSKALADRASDFDTKKAGINQGISTVTAASTGVTGIQAIVQQLQGLVLNAKSAQTSTEITNLQTQFNLLRTQINKLASDSSYQGLNLVNGSGSTLSVSFSNDTASKLDVNSVDVSVRGYGLAINKVNALSTSSLGTFAGAAFDYSSVDIGQKTLSFGGTLTVTLAASADIVLTTPAASISFTYGTYTVIVSVGDSTVTGTFNTISGTPVTLQAGCAYTFTLLGSASGITGANAVNFNGVSSASNTTVAALASNVDGVSNLSVGYANQMNTIITNLNTALTTIRSDAQSLGANVALLKTRLDYTTNYVNTLTDGSGKLTLADLNQEGANLLALQTRQQLGIHSLSFAGQSEQAVLGLFR